MSEPRDSRADAALDYARDLERRAGARWKRWLGVQLPYRWKLRRLRLGRTLEVGCGVGRLLAHLPPGSIGIDPNPHAVERARRRGLAALTPEAFAASGEALPGAFDALLLAHVVEHMRRAEAEALVGRYLGFVRRGGRVVLIAPQEAGFRADPTHVAFADAAALELLLAANGVRVEASSSFPLPRFAGAVFPYNEFVVVGRLP